MTLTHQLRNLEANGLILLAQTQPELEYLFRHALVQEAAYGSLVRIDRRMLHQAVGQALERLHPAQLDSLELAPVLARHFAEAGDPARALRYYTRAARGAASMYANAEAVLLYTQAIELAQALHTDSATLVGLFLQRGHTYEVNAQDAEAIANYEALEAWGAAHGDQAAQLAAIAACATVYVKPSVQQNQQRGYDLSQQALTLARELHDPAAEAKVLWNLLQHHMAAGQFDEALAQGEQALAIAREQGLREQEAYVLTDLMKVLFQVGQPVRARAALEASGIIWRDLGIRNMLADYLASSSMMRIMEGKYDQALAFSGEAVLVSRQIANLWNEAYAYYMVDMAYFERGDIARAIESARTCHRLSEQAGFAEGISQSILNLALFDGYLGALPRSLATLSRADVRNTPSASIMASLPEAEALTALIYVLNGRLSEAQAVLDSSQVAQNPADLKRQFVLTQFIFASVMVELALAHGDAASALQQAEDIGGALRQNGVQLFLPDTFYYQGRALRAAGQTTAAQSAFEAARAAGEAVGSRRTLWSILAELSALAAERGEATAARDLLTQSVEIIDYIADHAGEAELAESFRGRPQVRAVLEAAALAAEQSVD